MGKDYSANLMKMVKMAKNGNQQAQLILAVTDLTRVFDTIDPENAAEDVKQDMVAAFVSKAGGDAKAARRILRQTARELRIVRRWLRERTDMNPANEKWSSFAARRKRCR